MLEINRDLVRWSRRQWYLAIGGLVALQLALVFHASQITAHQTEDDSFAEPRTIYSFASLPAESFPSDWRDVIDPMLFAGPHPNGFSGLAWMQRPEREYLERWTIPKPEFLRLREARTLGLSRVTLPAYSPSPHIRSPTRFIEPEDVRDRSEPQSRLLVEGVEGRPLLKAPELPVQFHSDVVGHSVVSVLVDADGVVVSSHLVSGSGLKKADADAVAIARSARFAPAGSTSQGTAGEVALGKLIFEWHALHLSDSNNVTRANAR